MTARPIQTAIAHYHDLCTADRVADSWALLEGGMRSQNLLFGGRLICQSLRPQFLAVDEWRAICRASALLASAFDRTLVACLHDDSLLAELQLSADEAAVARLDPGVSVPVPMGRLDGSFVRPDASSGEPNLYVVEYNAECPAAIAFEDGLAALFLQTPLLQAFAAEYPLRPLWGKPAALQALLHGYRAWGGRSLPRIAIVDWLDVPTASEFMIFRDYFVRHGLDAELADVRDLDYRGGVLYAAGRPVDLVYKRVLTGELLTCFGLGHPLIEASRERAACLVNPLRSAVLHKKASLAFVSDERHTALFTSAEQAAIRRHVPWTRRVEERFTEFAGRTVDLVPFILQERERLVLKPNDGYGGKGIILGWEATDLQWRAAVATALAQPYVVQLRVPMAHEEFPCRLADGAICIEPRLVDCDPFLFGGTYAGGCLTRLSAQALLNVTAGGGSLVPTFVVADRLS